GRGGHREGEGKPERTEQGGLGAQTHQEGKKPAPSRSRPGGSGQEITAELQEVGLQISRASGAHQPSRREDRRIECDGGRDPSVEQDPRRGSREGGGSKEKKQSRCGGPQRSELRPSRGHLENDDCRGDVRSEGGTDQGADGKQRSADDDGERRGNGRRRSPGENEKTKADRRESESEEGRLHRRLGKETDGQRYRVLPESAVRLERPVEDVNQGSDRHEQHDLPDPQSEPGRAEHMRQSREE